ncbi:hypothetical protein CCMSSC00406_0008737 [Pleurotus cornucopiae]|uniref:Uncharacterized protein n=1 Tax=Pleurotus cornucopiae TaxID=5321 RepID=A0ACB7J728_PLECO|nr:hypothetical protein CCMSSC00406_0008737 [Pleurotus cornucopiae]
MKIVPVPVRQDNYAYILIDEPSNKAAAVDPYDVPKVKAAADKLGVEIVAGITTHHHFDHSGGNEAFAKAYPGVPIYGGSDKIPALTDFVKDNSEFTVGTDTHIKCLATPCHTQDSICYYATTPEHPGAVFTGDTLFIGGCGRFFEGTGEEMHAALSYLGTLPSKTLVYPGHEYAGGNIAFARSVASDGEVAKGIQKLEAVAKEHSSITGVTTIGEEKGWNVFMQLQDATVRQGAGVPEGASDVSVMDKLRELKNNYRG